jgi:hypothetical protein
MFYLPLEVRLVGRRDVDELPAIVEQAFAVFEP